MGQPICQNLLIQFSKLNEQFYVEIFYFFVSFNFECLMFDQHLQHRVLDKQNMNKKKISKIRPLYKICVFYVQAKKKLNRLSRTSFLSVCTHTHTRNAFACKQMPIDMDCSKYWFSERWRDEIIESVSSSIKLLLISHSSQGHQKLMEIAFIWIG